MLNMRLPISLALVIASILLLVIQCMPRLIAIKMIEKAINTELQSSNKDIDATIAGILKSTISNFKRDLYRAVDNENTQVFFQKTIYNLTSETQVLAKFCSVEDMSGHITGSGLAFTNGDYFYCSNYALDIKQNGTLQKYTAVRSYASGKFGITLSPRSGNAFPDYSKTYFAKYAPFKDEYTTSKQIENSQEEYVLFVPQWAGLPPHAVGVVGTTPRVVYFSKFDKTAWSIPTKRFSDNQAAFILTNDKRVITTNRIPSIENQVIGQNADPLLKALEPTNIKQGTYVIQYNGTQNVNVILIESQPELQLYLLAIRSTDSMFSDLMLAKFVPIPTVVALLLTVALILLQVRYYERATREVITALTKIEKGDDDVHFQQRVYYIEFKALETELKQTAKYLKEQSIIAKSPPDPSSEYVLVVRPSALKTVRISRSAQLDSIHSIEKYQPKIMSMEDSLSSIEIDLSSVQGMAFTGENYKTEFVGEKSMKSIDEIPENQGQAVVTVDTEEQMDDLEEEDDEEEEEDDKLGSQYDVLNRLKNMVTRRGSMVPSASLQPRRESSAKFGSKTMLQMGSFQNIRNIESVSKSYQNLADLPKDKTPRQSESAAFEQEKVIIDREVSADSSP